MVIKDADYYLAQYVLKAITLVDQDYVTPNGPETRAEVWNLYKWLVVHPQNEHLPEVHKTVKILGLSFSKTKMKTQLKAKTGSTILLAFGLSTGKIYRHYHTLAPSREHQGRKRFSRNNLLARRISYVWSVMEHGGGDIELHGAAAQLDRAKSHVSHRWLMIDSVCVFFCECPKYFLLQ